MPSFSSTGTTSPAATFDHRGAAEAPTTFAVALASSSTVLAATLVYASSLTFGFSSLISGAAEFWSGRAKADLYEQHIVADVALAQWQ